MALAPVDSSQKRPSKSPVLEALPAHEANMPTSFRLTVIVPVYNERHVVAASLRRLLAIDHELIDSLEVIVVDDRSTDGTWEVLQEVTSEDPRIRLFRHEKNAGKGAAIRTAIAEATGDITIIHDADLEYNPADIPALLVPFVKEGADAVFGSRYLSAPYRRALMFRHTLINKTLTTIGNWLTDLFLTDIETCYKAINTTLLKSIPIRSNDFRFEVEIVSKLAKRRARVFEAPIRYLPRSLVEGKKIRARDGLWAIIALLRFWVIDDIYKKDAYGSNMLVELGRVRRFTLWMGDVLRPYIGNRVLEIGAGIGTLTNQFIPRDLYVASDVNRHYLQYLRSYSFGKPYLRIMNIDVCKSEDFKGLDGEFDTVLMTNVLEHIADEQVALRNIWEALEPGGRLVVVVPNHPSLYGTLDQVLEHRQRYTAAKLTETLETAGFRLEKVFDFNRVSVPGWWFNSKVLRRKRYSRVQLKLINNSIPVLRRIDRMWPWSGLSLIGIAVKD